MRRPSVKTPGFRVVLTLAFVFTIASSVFFENSAHAQWVSFVDETVAHSDAPSLRFEDDENEKDYAWADFDQDGDIDLVVVRKQPFSTNGKRTNVLLMNEGISDGHAVNGVLVDYTDMFATASTVPGDQGFNTPTNDRDIFVADFNNDGFADILTGNIEQRNQLFFGSESMDYKKHIDISTSEDSTFSLDVADYDNDGDIDIVIGNHNSSNRVYRNTENGLKFIGVDLSAQTYNTYDIKFIDINNDKHLDIVEANSEAVNVFYYNTIRSRTEN